VTDTPVPAACPVCGTIDDPAVSLGAHLCSGFRYSHRLDAGLSPEARARVLAKIASVDRARARAAAEARTAWIG
jgi:hypothetical protein